MPPRSLGCETKFFKFTFVLFFVAEIYVYRIYSISMKANPTPQSVLNDIAQIQHMERGSLSVIRQGPKRPYYNHQCYEKGRNVSRYVPGDQVADLEQAIAGYHRFKQLAEQYVQLMVEKTRAERAAGSKKN